MNNQKIIQSNVIEKSGCGFCYGGREPPYLDISFFNVIITIVPMVMADKHTGAGGQTGVPLEHSSMAAGQPSIQQAQNAAFMAPHQHLAVQQQPMLMQPQPVVIQIRRPPPVRYNNFQGDRSRKLGIAQIVCAILAVIFNAIGIGINVAASEYHCCEEYLDYPQEGIHESSYGRYYWSDSTGYYIGTGFWCSICFLVCGGFAIGAAKRPTKCMVVTCLVMSIISMVMAVIMFSMSIWNMAHDADRISEGFKYIKTTTYSGYYPNGTYFQPDPSSIETELYDDKSERYAKAIMVISPLFLCTSLVELIVAILICVTSSKVLCCSESQVDDNRQVQYLANQGQSQLLVLDRHGRPITDAQVVQLPGPIVPATNTSQSGGQLTQSQPSVVEASGQLINVRPPSYTPKVEDAPTDAPIEMDNSPPPPYQGLVIAD